jgi:hypothetical protein
MVLEGSGFEVVSGYAAIDSAEIIRQEHSVSGWFPINFDALLRLHAGYKVTSLRSGLRFIKMTL